MADPVWSSAYNFGNTPENNGFTRTVNGGVVTLTTTGPAAGRKVSINSDAGDAVCLTSSVPSLSEGVGATAQAIVAVTGAGDAGFELDFLNHNVQVLIKANSVVISLGDDANGNQNTEIPTASNGTATTIRLTVDSSGNIRVYRNTVLIFGPTQWPTSVSPFQRVLFWGEGGGTQVFTQMNSYLGGAVAP